MDGYHSTSDVSLTTITEATSNSDNSITEENVHNTWIVLITLVVVPLSIVGSFGNLLIMLSLRKYRKMRTIPNLYVLSLSVCDFIVCFIMMPYRAYSAWYKDQTRGCEAVAYFTFSVLILSMVNMTIVALNRYILVTKSSQLYSRIYTIRNVNISIVVMWLICFFMSLLPFAGFGRYGYNKKMGMCLFVDGDLGTYWFVQVIGHLVTAFPCLNFTLFIYVKIMLNLRGRGRKMHTVNVPGNMSIQPAKSVSLTVDNTTQNKQEVGIGVTQLKQKQRDRNMKVILNMFIVWFTFVCCWLPVITLFMVDVQNNVSATAYHILMTFAMFNSSLNPVIYAGMNRTFRKAFINLIQCRDVKHRNIAETMTWESEFNNMWHFIFS